MNKNLLCMNFPYRLDFFTKFQAEIRKIDLILLQRPNVESELCKDYIHITDFLGRAQVCVLNESGNISKILHFLRPNLNFGIITGSKMSGKKTMMREIKKKLKFDVISVRKLIEKIQAKKEEEGEEQENEPEAPEIDENLEEEEREAIMQRFEEEKRRNRKIRDFREACVLMKDYMMEKSGQQFLLEIDLISYPEDFFQIILDEISVPRFLIFLELSRENLYSRMNPDADPEEPDEEITQKCVQICEQSQTAKNYLLKMAETLDFFNFYEFDNTISMKKAKENILLLFKRDFVFLMNRRGKSQAKVDITQSKCHFL